jgi:DNA polymerase-3 subunit gamma/tau
VGDAKAVFETVDRLVQQGHDLRHFTGQVLGHFRDLLVVQSAPEEPAVLDAPPERTARLAAQAAKFSLAELSRILALLVAAQTDMRWTTSPRLTLELALVRASIPEADPSAAGLAARIERLERLAGVQAAGPAPDAVALKPSPVAPEVEPPAEPAAESPAQPAAETSPARAPTPVPHAPSAGTLDVGTIRRSWTQLLSHLQDRRQAVLRAGLESVTPASYDGVTLELAFPPNKKWAVQKVQSKEADLQEALVAIFGVSPRIACVERGVPAGVAVDDLGVEEEPPADAEEALARLKAELGAEVEAVEES